jgi:chorismate mutase/prephenate dehydratase
MPKKAKQANSEAELQVHRKAIDSIDSQIVALLNDRTEHVLAIGHIKVAAGGSIYAPHREKAVLDKVSGLNPGPVPDHSLHAIYREIMSCALSLEKTMSIAFLGPEATFTHQAAIRRFGNSLTYAAQKTIGDVFSEVGKGRADYGVVPIENSTEGVVNNTLDMFVDSSLKVVAQMVMPIQHCLVSRGAKTRIKKLYSHPQALGQCRAWVQAHHPKAEIIETSSTTRAAELAKEDKSAAAIASSLAAEQYNLRILEKNIQDNAANVTRFLVLGTQCSPSTGNDRTSLMFRITHEVGALHRALAPFQKHQLNMTKIESRPSKRKAWEYYFFLDVDGHVDDPPVKKALSALEKECGSIKILGSYPNTE